MDRITICAECRHCLDPNSIQHWQLCDAFQGEEYAPAELEGAGGRYRYCRYINKGSCDRYDKRVDVKTSGICKIGDVVMYQKKGIVTGFDHDNHRIIIDASNYVPVEECVGFYTPIQFPPPPPAEEQKDG